MLKIVSDGRREFLRPYVAETRIYSRRSATVHGRLVEVIEASFNMEFNMRPRLR
jgi:hypothetical protein